MTIGDILAVIALILVTAGAWIATILVTALFFPARVHRAQQQMIASPGRCALRGLGLLAVLAIPALLLLHLPGPFRLAAWIFWGMLAAAAAVGSAAMARLLGERIRETGSALSPFAALTRGAFLYVAAGLFPVVGWFIVTPVALFVSLGAAFASAKTASNPLSAPNEATPTGLNWEPLS